MKEGLRFVLGNRLLRAIARAPATSNLFSRVGSACSSCCWPARLHLSAGTIGLLFSIVGGRRR